MGKYIIDVDESDIVECWNEQAAKELGYQEYALKQCPKIKVKPYNPTGDCISRKDLRKQVVAARSWYTPICSGGTEYGEGAIGMADEIIELIDDAPAVEITEEQAINKLHETGWLIEHDKEMTTRPQGECCDSCYLCDVGNCDVKMQKGSTE